MIEAVLTGAVRGGTSILYASLGETDKASQYRALFENVIQTLAQNFAAEDPLRASLLAVIETKSGRSTAGPSPP